MFVQLARSSAPRVTLTEVADFATAQRVVRAYIAGHNLGAGCSDHSDAFMGGAILAADKKTPLGRVSYNGRVWNQNGKEIRI